jgi:hypothetical protein
MRSRAGLMWNVGLRFGPGASALRLMGTGDLDISRHALASGLVWHVGWRFGPGASALRLMGAGVRSCDRERCLELSAGALEALVEGVAGDAERLGGVGGRVALQVAENHGFAVSRGELGNGVPNSVGLFVFAGEIVRGRRLGRRPPGNPAGEETAAEPLPAAMGATGVDCDARKPGFEPGVAAERVPAGERRDQDVLDEVVMVGTPGVELANEPGDIGQDVRSDDLSGRGVAGAERVGHGGPVEFFGRFEFCRRQTLVSRTPQRALGRGRLVALADQRRH